MTRKHFIFAAKIAGSIHDRQTQNAVVLAFGELFEKFNYNFSKKEFREAVEKVHDEGKAQDEDHQVSSLRHFSRLSGLHNDL